MYVAGSVAYYFALYIAVWINGVPQYWGEYEPGTSHKIFAHGNDVYVLGNLKFWKNGVVQQIDGMNYPRGLFVSESGNVYMSDGRLWINGEMQTLTGINNISTIYVK